MTDSDPQSIVQDYLNRFQESWTDDSIVDGVRFVALDSESTGLDPQRDYLITIGAIAVRNHQILLEDSFEVLMPIAYNTAAVQIHGITAEESRKGIPEPDAMLELIAYLKDAVIVGHHIGFDVGMLNRALKDHHGIELKNRTVDTMDLTLRLRQKGALKKRSEVKEFSLDALCQLFGVEPHDRHTATGDAFITAQIFLKLLILARHVRMETLGEFCKDYNESGG